MTPAPPWSLVYADGSANVYRFHATAAGVRFVYQPVTPERSSTGRYRGGEPVEADLAIDDPRLTELWRLAVAVEADSTRHAATRNKGDGAFTVTSGGATRDFLVVRAAVRAFEALLEGIRTDGAPT